MNGSSKLCPNPNCRKRFVPRRPDQKYCSKQCRPSYMTYGSGLDLASGTVGAIAELAVSADLMRRGFEVFRALSPSSSCDLLAIRQPGLPPVKIEVRSASRHVDGKLGCAMQKIRADVLAQFVHQENAVVYSPELT